MNSNKYLVEVPHIIPEYSPISVAYARAPEIIDGVNTIPKLDLKYEGFLQSMATFGEEISKSVARGTINTWAVDGGTLLKNFGDSLVVDDKTADLYRQLSPDDWRFESGQQVGRWLSHAGESLRRFGEFAVNSPELKPNEKVFAGDFVDNPSATRAVASMFGAVPSLLSMAALTKVAGAKAGYLLFNMLDNADILRDTENRKDISQGKRWALFAAGTGLTVAADYYTKPLELMFGNHKWLKALKSKGARAALAALSEGGNEGLQQGLQNMVKKYGYDNTQSLIEGVIESAFVGLVTGGAGRYGSDNYALKHIVGPDVRKAVGEWNAKAAETGGPMISEADAEMLAETIIADGNVSKAMDKVFAQTMFDALSKFDQALEKAQGTPEYGKLLQWKKEVKDIGDVLFEMYATNKPQDVDDKMIRESVKLLQGDILYWANETGTSPMEMAKSVLGDFAVKYDNNGNAHWDAERAAAIAEDEGGVRIVPENAGAENVIDEGNGLDTPENKGESPVNKENDLENDSAYGTMEEKEQIDDREYADRENEFRGIQEASRSLSDLELQRYHGSNKVDEGVRGRLAPVLSRWLGARHSRNGYDTRLLNNSKTNTDITLYGNVDAETFHDVFETVQRYLPNGDAVDVHDTADYQNNKNYLTKDGMSGFSITPDGNLISVFNIGEPGFLRTIAPIVKQQAKKLDCFNSPRQKLPNMYEYVFGFKTASVLDFNYEILEQTRGREYADYFVKTYGNAPVHFMVNTAADVDVQRFGKDGYDAALNYRDALVEKDTDETEQETEQEPQEDLDSLIGDNEETTQSGENLPQTNETTAETLTEGQEETAAPATEKDGKKETGKPETQDIQDFGEVIHGSRKELWAQTAGVLRRRAEMDSFTGRKASEIFPKPNYDKMIADGFTTDAVAVLQAYRDALPYMLKYGSDTAAIKKMLNDAANIMTGDKDALDAALSIVPDLLDIRGDYSLWNDNEKLMKWITGSMIKTKIALGYPKSTMTKWFVALWDDGKYHVFTAPDRYYPHSLSFETALDYLTTKERLQKKIDDAKTNVGKPKKPRYRYYVYIDRETGERYIGRQTKSAIIRVKEGFKTGDEARAYIKEHSDDLDRISDEMRKIKDRGEENRPRVGEDYLGGGDISIKGFEDAFKFRGVQFGNYVEQGRRQADMNDAYNSLTDLAKTLNIPTQAISLNGTLGLAFGARGTGGFNAAKAHYEPVETVINLTKNKGAGSLAHEWFHALDNYLSQSGLDYLSELRYSEKVRAELVDAFRELDSVLAKSNMKKVADKLSDYWSEKVELAARAFESYVIDKMKQKGFVNDYLANINEESGVYPHESDKAAVYAAFDRIFDTLKVKPGDNGSYVLYQSDVVKDNDHYYVDGQGNKIELTEREGGPKIADDNATIKPVVLDGVENMPKGLPFQEFKKWLLENWNIIGEVTVSSTGQKITISDSGFEQSLKRHGRLHKQIYKALKSIIENALYSGYKPTDADHVHGQDVYHSAFIYRGNLFAVRIKADNVENRDLHNYADHVQRKIEILPKDTATGLFSPNRLPSESTSITLAVLSGKVKPARYDAVNDKLFQTSYKGDISERARGKIAQDKQGRAIISLMKNANASTLIHETGHLFMMQLEKYQDVSVRAKEMYMKSKMWMRTEFDARYSVAAGADGGFTVNDKLGNAIYDFGFRTAEEARAYGEAELFARGFEKYCMEGVAPTPWLKKTFAAFRRWLIKVYDTVKGDLHVEPSDDVKSVYADLIGGDLLRFYEEETDPQVKADYMAAKENEWNDAFLMALSTEPTGTEAKESVARETLEQAAKGWDYWMKGIDRRAYDVSEKFGTRLRRYEFDLGRNLNKYLARAKPFVDLWNVMEKDDRERLDLILKNQGTVLDLQDSAAVKERNAILDKYDGGREAYDAVVSVMETLKEQGKQAGMEFGELNDYFPRKVRLYEKLIAELTGDPDVREGIDVELEKAKAKKGAELSTEEKAEVIDKYIRRMRMEGSRINPSNTKSRKLGIIDRQLNKYYVNSVEALLSYIENMNRAIENRRIWGYDKSAESFGTIAAQMVEDGVIETSEIEETKRILNARLNERGVTNPVLKSAQALSYIYTMGGINTAFRQLDDTAMAIYKAGFGAALKTAGIVFADTVTTIKDKLTGQETDHQIITKEDLGIEAPSVDIADSTSGSSRLNRFLNKLFEVNGVSIIDSFGKNLQTNSVRRKYHDMAQSEEGRKKLRKKLAYLEDDVDATIDDFKNGRKTDNVLFVLFNELADVQPVTKSQMPEGYLTSGNGRVLYMLKSFMVKRLNMITEEALRKMARGARQGNMDLFCEGAGNMTKLATLFIIAGGGADWLINLMYGRKFDVADSVIDNILNMFMINRFTVYRAKERGAEAFVNAFLPLALIAPESDLALDVYRTLFTDRKIKDAETWKGIPILGRFYYWWLGRGVELKKKQDKKRKKGNAI